LPETDYPTCEKTYVTLRIYPGELDPIDVTARLGMEPSDWQRRGETFIGSRRSGCLAKLHGWFLTSEGTVDSNDVRKHLDWLLMRIAPKSDAILVLQEQGCKMV
jgi:Domain of unknown function (DUF4279)